MKGFIVASINKKDIKKSVGLDKQLIRYTPAIADSAEDVVKQYEESFSDHAILLTIPTDVLKKNIEVAESLARQQGLVLE